MLAREPDLGALPAATPPSIRRLLRHCLSKDPHERLRDIGDARLAIRDASGSDPESAAAARRRGTPSRRAWILALAVSALALAASVPAGPAPGSRSPEMRLDIATPPSASPLSVVAISPDGRSLAFVATSGGRSLLWLRSLESGSARPLAGTDGADCPFWSPDSRALAFFAGDKLRRVDVAGGSVQVLASATSGCGGTWNDGGVILFAPLDSPIARIPAGGGERSTRSRT